MDTRLAPFAVQDDSITSIDADGPFTLATSLVDEQALPESLRPADELLRRLASVPHAEPPADLVERTLQRCVRR